MGGVAERNIRANGMSHVSLDRRAAGPTTGERIVVGKTPVETVCLDDACRQYAIAQVRALKVDVDGADFGVLEGAQDLLRTHRPLIIVEMADRQGEIYDLLRETGYRHLLGMRGESVSPGAWPPNLIASMDEVRFPRRGTLSG